MRRVVVTGIGIVSCIGNDAATVTHHLKHSISGLKIMLLMPKWVLEAKSVVYLLST